jgi:putative membrane protein
VRWSALILAALLLPLGWALSGQGMSGHMASHMIAVAVAAPLLAFALSGSGADPARLWPRVVTPMAMMLVELVAVWSWHLPALRRVADASLMVTALEQASFLAAGLMLWSAVLQAANRVAGVGALLLTSMHMTLLGALVGLAQRPLYPAAHHHGGAFGLDALADQQLGGVIMLLVGGFSYLVGGLALLAGVLRTRTPA